MVDEKIGRRELGQVLQTEKFYYKIRQVFQYGAFITKQGILLFFTTLIIYFKGTVMQIEKAPVKDRLRVSKVS